MIETIAFPEGALLNISTHEITTSQSDVTLVICAKSKFSPAPRQLYFYETMW